MLRFGPKLVWRLMTGQQTMGGALVVGLLKGCLDAGCTLWNRSPARSLIRTGERVEGVEVERGAGPPVKLLARKGVVLASGGFEWNAELMAEHFPGPVEWTGSPATNTGDGHRMAAAIGARLDHMDQALVIGTMPYRYEGRVQGTPSGDFMLPHSMIVNRHARRFVNEKAMNIGLAFEERDAGTGLPVHLPAWRIYDGQFARKYPHALPPRRFAGVRHEDRTLEGLARQDRSRSHGAWPRPPGDSASSHAPGSTRTSGAARRSGIGSTSSIPITAPIRRSAPSSGPPFYAMPFKPSFLGTKGGPRTNERGQVLDHHGSGDPRSLRGGKRDGEPLRLQGGRGRDHAGTLPHLGPHLRAERRRRALSPPVLLRPLRAARGAGRESLTRRLRRSCPTAWPDQSILTLRIASTEASSPKARRLAKAAHRRSRLTPDGMLTSSSSFNRSTGRRTIRACSAPCTGSFNTITWSTTPPSSVGYRITARRPEPLWPRAYIAN